MATRPRRAAASRRATSVTPKDEESDQDVTLDSATYRLWQRLGSDKKLPTDSLIAKFLLEHYQTASTTPRLTECVQCQGPLSQYCAGCNAFISQAPPASWSSKCQTPKRQELLTQYPPATKESPGRTPPKEGTNDNGHAGNTSIHTRKKTGIPGTDHTKEKMIEHGQAGNTALHTIQKIGTTITDEHSKTHQDSKSFSVSRNSENRVETDLTTHDKSPDVNPAFNSPIRHSTRQRKRKLGKYEAEEEEEMEREKRACLEMRATAITKNKIKTTLTEKPTTDVLLVKPTDSTLEKTSSKTDLSEKQKHKSLPVPKSTVKAALLQKLRATANKDDIEIATEANGAKAEPTRATLPPKVCQKEPLSGDKIKLVQAGAEETGSAKVADTVSGSTKEEPLPSSQDEKNTAEGGKEETTPAKESEAHSSSTTEAEQVRTTTVKPPFKRPRKTPLEKGTKKTPPKGTMKTPSEKRTRKTPTEKRTRKSIKKEKILLYCETCGLGFRSQHTLDNHLRFHTGEKPYKCDQCGAEYSREDNLNLHKRRHQTGKFLPCQYCPAMFLSMDELRQHYNTHCDQRPFICEVCAMSFQTVRSLTLHRSVHDERKRFSCPQCGREFRWRKNLTDHIRAHKQEKRYVCPHCQKAFVQSSSLRHHMSIQHNPARQRPFVCHVCQAAFHTREPLRHHVMTHTGVRPYKCHICGAAFIQPSPWRNHMKIHTEARGKQFFCPVCKAGFLQRASIKKHMNKVHLDVLSKEVKAEKQEEDLGEIKVVDFQVLDNDNVQGVREDHVQASQIVQGSQAKDGKVLLCKDGKVPQDVKVEVQIDRDIKVLQDHVNVLPDHGKVLPDHVNVLPDHGKVLPDPGNVLADGAEVVSDGVMLLPSHVQVHTDQVIKAVSEHDGAVHRERNSKDQDVRVMEDLKPVSPTSYACAGELESVTTFCCDVDPASVDIADSGLQLGHDPSSFVASNAVITEGELAGHCLQIISNSGDSDVQIMENVRLVIENLGMITRAPTGEEVTIVTLNNA